MGWIGGVIGSFCGQRFGGMLGALAGAIVGSYLENQIRGAQVPKTRRSRPASSAERERRSVENETVFLTAAGAMLAKLSKADGRVDETEIAAGERAFARLGLSADKREFCIRAFRAAKMDGHSIYEYAESFAGAVRATEMRILFYDILWDLACADGVVTPEEMDILQRIVSPLRVPQMLFFEERSRRLAGSGTGQTRDRRSSGRSSSAPRTPSPDDPYEVLGCSRRASDDEVRRAYRALAKKLHPDLLRAQGLPEEMLRKANDRMARVNAAWEQVKRERGLA